MNGFDGASAVFVVGLIGLLLFALFGTKGPRAR